MQNGLSATCELLQHKRLELLLVHFFAATMNHTETSGLETWNGVMTVVDSKRTIEFFVAYSVPYYKTIV
jgi:hypothetical protein